MKKIIILSILLFHVSFIRSVGAQEGWFWQNPLPQGNTLNDVYVFDENTVVAVGVKGTVLKTSDGGATWEFQQNTAGVTENLNAVSFVDTENGWAVGDSGVVLHTNDGGENWEAQNAGLQYILHDVQFVDADTGWVIGNISPQYDAIILKTDNGGITWDSLFSVPGIGPFWDIFFFNSQRGWLTGGTNLYKTVDGGVTWDSLTINPPFYPFSIYFINDDIGWMSEVYNEWQKFGVNANIYQTTNGGQSWNPLYTSGYVTISEIEFIDSMTGWALGLEWSFPYYVPNVLKTTDGGITWTEQMGDSRLKSFDIAGSNIAWTVGENGRIWHTNDGGANWAYNSVTDRQLESVYFLDSNIGWAAGWSSYCDFEGNCYDSDEILMTTDGGSSWFLRTRPGLLGTYDIFFINANTGWAVGGGVSGENSFSGIVKTTDGGISWELQYGQSSLYRWFFSVHFVDNQNGWAAGNNGTIFKTSDGGANWDSLNTGTTKWLYSVHFVDALTGWAAGQEGTILKSTDGGANWESQSINSPSNLNSVFFVDASNGWIAGEGGNYPDRYGIILKTMNGGVAWDSLLIDTIPGLSAVYFTDAQTGWAAGSGNSYVGLSIGIILNTTDGGTTWDSQFSGATSPLNALYFTDAYTGWAVGNEGTIVSTLSGGIVSVESDPVKAPSILGILELHQNFPNPFNPITTIEFSLPKAGFTTLKVYNILGEEVATLVSENLSAGNHRYYWNAGSFASGLYFYKIEIDRHSLIKKALLMK